MNLNHVLRYVGMLILFLGISMIAPLVVSIVYQDGSSYAVLYSMLTALFIGFVILILFKKNKEAILNHRDGVAIVTFGWIAAGLIGTLPFLYSGSIHGFTNAYFETVSGFTTTGSTILHDIEILPESILLWRSIIQWLGGMGIIVLSIAVLPFLGVGGMQLYRAEIPSPVVDKLKPRISDTARILWKVYLLLTTFEIVLLSIGGMPLFESVCHTFCTMPTGGFSPKNASIAYYNSPYLETIIILFMIIAGINFSLHYRILKGDFSALIKDPECRVFLGILAFLIVLVTGNLHETVYDSLGKAFRYASFQVGSIMTTTGFATADFEKWPPFSQSIIVLCMFLGGMAGSTGGGIKTMRIILLMKHSYCELFRIIHPHAVINVKLGGRAVSTDIINSIWGFFILYLAFFIVSSIMMAFLGLDLVSSVTSVAACIFNVGPGLGLVGPVDNFLVIPVAGKWVLIFCMLLGRLEIYTVIVMLLPEYWRR